MFKSKLSKIVFLFFLLGSSLMLQSSSPGKPLTQTSALSTHMQQVDYFYFYYSKEFRTKNGCWASVFYVVVVAIDAENHLAGIGGEVISMDVDCGPHEYFARIEARHTGTTVTSLRFVGDEPKIDDELNQFEEESLKLLNADIQTVL